MRCFVFAAGLIAAALPASAQQNPFRAEKSKIKNAEVSYAPEGRPSRENLPSECPE